MWGVHSTSAYGHKRPSTHARPGVLEEPEPQVRAATVGHVAAAGPLLAQPVLGGGDTLDAAAVQFEAKEFNKNLLKRLTVELRQQLLDSESAPSKRKKKRRKKLPKTLLLSSISSRYSHVETWTSFPWPLLGSTVDAYSYVSLAGFWWCLLDS